MRAVWSHGFSKAFALLPLLLAACSSSPAASEPAIGGDCRGDGDCGENGACVGASGCSSGLCTLPCAADMECPSRSRCVVFESVDGKGVPSREGYCLIACRADPDCDSHLCDPELGACVTASLRYDLGSPDVMSDETCESPPSSQGADSQFADSTRLTEPGEVYAFGPAVALDPVDSGIRYVAYNSVAGTDVSVTLDAGQSWQRVSMNRGGAGYNIGDPGISVDPETRAVWHSFLTVPEAACTLDHSSSYQNTVALTVSSDHGSTWSRPLPLDVGRYAEGFFIDRPALVARGGVLAVTFVAIPADIDDPHTEVVLARSSDQGSSWAITTVNGATRSVLRRAPSIAVTPSGAIHIAWFEKASVEDHSGSVWIARSNDDGQTFSEQRISDVLYAKDDGPTVSFAGSGSDVFVVFGASPPNNLAPEAIYLAGSSNGGESFGPPQRLTHFCGSAWNPTSTTDAQGNLWGLWYQSLQGRSRLVWMRLAEPALPGNAQPVFGSVPGSESPFTMSRSPLVSLGDFVGLATSNGVTAVAWTSLTHMPVGGTIYIAATDGIAP